MDTEEQMPKSYEDFLLAEDGSFVIWRLTGDSELGAHWEKYRQSHPELEQEIQKAIRVADSIRLNDFAYGESETLLQNIQCSIAQQHKRQQWYRWVAVAAMLVLLALPLGYLALGRWGADQVYQENLVAKAQGTDVVLTVGGKSVSVSSADPIVVSKGCVYGRDRMKPLLSGDRCNISVPYGKHVAMLLDDGSQLWVNANTQVEVPTRFGRTARDIRVNGEVYVDVVHQPSRPFTVYTKDMNVAVHGTSFGVSAYHDDSTPSVVLVKGKVTVQSTTGQSVAMSPNEQVRLVGNRMEKRGVDVRSYVSWKDNYLLFDNTPITEVFQQVGKYYGIVLTAVDSHAMQQNITGKLYLSNRVEGVLDAIALLTHATYTTRGSKVEFSKRAERESSTQ